MFLMGYGENDFYHVKDAVPNEDGMIEVPVIPLRDVVIYPNMVMPLFVGRESSMMAIQAAPSAWEAESRLATPLAAPSDLTRTTQLRARVHSRRTWPRTTAVNPARAYG